MVVAADGEADGVVGKQFEAAGNRLALPVVFLIEDRFTEGRRAVVALENQVAV